MSPLFDGIYSVLDDIPNFRMLIGGKWRGAKVGSQFDVHTPIDGSVIARAQMASLMDVDSAVTAAKRKQRNKGPAGDRAHRHLQLRSRIAGSAQGRVRQGSTA